MSPDGGVPSDRLEAIRHLGDENYYTARQALGDTLTLVDDLEDLYELLGELIGGSDLTPRDEIVTGLYFLLFCRYHLRLAVLSLLRGHRNDSYSHVRQSIEATAFAARIHRHPHLAWVWLHASRDDDAFAKYREKFSPGKLFPEDQAALGDLYERYDLCSARSHPSLKALAGFAVVNEREDQFEAGFNYFQFSREDPSEPPRTFLWIVDTHFRLLQVFQEVFSDATRSENRWKLRMNTFEARLVVSKERWRPVIAPEQSE